MGSVGRNAGDSNEMTEVHESAEGAERAQGKSSRNGVGCCMQGKM